MDERFVVIGAGTMGVGIAYVAAGAGYRVELVKIDSDCAETARRTLHSLWDTAIERGKVSTAGAEASRTRVTFASDVAQVADGPEVIPEAVPERVDLKLTDVVGLDVRLGIARTLASAYGQRFAPPQLLEDMVAQGKLGKKSGEGFYTW